MSQFAAATRQVVAETFVGAADTEHEVSERLVERRRGPDPAGRGRRSTTSTACTCASSSATTLSTRRTPATADARPTRSTSRSRFADLVGFTELGEKLPPEELGGVTGRLEELAREVIKRPVRLVKLIGDAAMFASPDTEALLDAAFELVERMAGGAEGRTSFPLLRAGVARGVVLSPRRRLLRARRSTSPAGSPRRPARERPGLRGGRGSELTDAYDFSDAGSKRLKGISGRSRSTAAASSRTRARRRAARRRYRSSGIAAARSPERTAPSM